MIHSFKNKEIEIADYHDWYSVFRSIEYRIRGFYEIYKYRTCGKNTF